MKSRTSNTSRAIRDRMKKKLLLEQAAKQKQEKMNLELAKNLISTQAERNKMDNTERDNQLMKLLENRDKMPLRTQVRIDKFVEDFFRITKEDGIEFNDDGTTNHELSTYEENDDYKDFEDNRKVAAKATATAETKIMRSVAAEAKKQAKTEPRTTLFGTAPATAIATTEVVTADAAAAATVVPKTEEEIAALQKATDYIHDYLFKGHYQDNDAM